MRRPLFPIHPLPSVAVSLSSLVSALPKLIYTADVSIQLFPSFYVDDSLIRFTLWHLSQRAPSSKELVVISVERFVAVENHIHISELKREFSFFPFPKTQFAIL